MPFKLKLKKSRQYNVSSKNLFVLSVELLDNTNVECTLSAQSLGQECLNNVSQRLGLQQSQYFGLRFMSKKGNAPWWIDLNRPLKKQLDKYALDPTSLQLQVMFFVHDVQLLHDEVTRYHYFLQLKSDILEGKLSCSEDQAILFASYSLQAEFGDHDPERHTTEYLTNFGLLPKLVEGDKEALLERVIQCHRTLLGMSQQLAEVYYIREAQSLSGYGLECFAAKNHSGSPIIVGVSLVGIHLWHLNNQPNQSSTIFFPWDLILNLVHQKRCFGIESRSESKIIQCHMDDSHIAKYLWKISILQHGFYTKNEGLLNSPSEPVPEIRQPNISVVVNHRSTPSKTERKKNSLTLKESQESLDGLGIYYTEGRYSERKKPVNIDMITVYNNSTQISKESIKGVGSPSTSNFTRTDPSNTSSNIKTTVAPSLLLQQNSLHGSAPYLQRASSTDVQSFGIQEMPRPVCSVLPIYRQAPDYDTAVQIKYGIQSCSTGDVSKTHFLHSQISPESYSQYRNYNDLSHLGSTDVEHLHAPSALVKTQEFMSAPSLHPPVHASSSPDLAPLPHPPRPPPPYPCRGSSTPDLSLQTSLLPNPLSYSTPIECAKMGTPQHAILVSSKVKMIQNSPPNLHTYENYNPTEIGNPSVLNTENAVKDESASPCVATYPDIPVLRQEECAPIGPMLMAAMNGLSLSRHNILVSPSEEIRSPDDNRVFDLEQRLSEGRVFLEFEIIPKKRPDADFTTALLPENAARNRFRDVFPYENNRVCLTPTLENRTGYINASHINIYHGDGIQRQYIAAQGPLPNTLYSFWQLIWEHQVLLVVMLTQVQEEGLDKCFPYWPQEDGNKLQIGEFQIARNFSMASPTYVTCSLSLCHVPSQQQRSIWHVRYTDWHDHSCPTDIQGFIAFLVEVDAVRRHSGADNPVLVHCSAGVGRSGTLILSDIMLYCLDHNKPIRLPKVLTILRFQRMLTVQTLAQYKFVYCVLIQYLKNTRLI